MEKKKVINYIVSWLSNHLKESNKKGFVVGISGGIDSALTSTLAAITIHPVLCLEMPIHQNTSQIERGKNHIDWLKNNYKNVTSIEIDLTHSFDSLITLLNHRKKKNDELAKANVRARLRMTTLYYYAQLNDYLVTGTGNKVEDFGIGFFTKYGDGGVDLSPIADLLKTEVYELAKYLRIDKDILEAPPTDGLWDDNKTDEDQIGATYKELEFAMTFNGNKKLLTEREREVIHIYSRLNKQNYHKMNPIPVCIIPKK